MVNAKVLFEYSAEQDDELSLNVGETVKNIDCQNGGWWEGEVNGKRGMFPENFVEIISGETSADPPPAKATEKKGKARRAKVTFDYEAEQPDELSLAVGDVVEITLEEDDGWWEGILNGKAGAFPSNFVEVIEYDDSSGNSRKPALPPEPAKPTVDPQIPIENVTTDSVDAADKPAKTPEVPDKPKNTGVGFGGLFSAADLQKKLRPVSMMEEPVKKSSAPKIPTLKAPAPPANTGHKKQSSADAPKTKRAAPALPPEPALTPSSPSLRKEKAKVIFGFEPENSDELELTIGDVITITSKSVSDGWWEGEVRGKKGVFPNNFVELIATEDNSKPTASVAPIAKPPPPSAAAGPRRPLLPPPGKHLSDAPSSTSAVPPHDVPHAGRPPPPEVKRSEHKKPSPPLPGAKPPKPSLSGKLNKAPEKPQPPETNIKELQGRSSSFGVRSGPPQPPKPTGLKKPSQTSIDESFAERSASVSEVRRMTNGERKASGEVDFDAVHASDVLQNVNKSRVKGPAKNLPTKKTLPRNDSADKSDDKTDGKPSWMNDGQHKDKARSPSSSSQDGKALADSHSQASGVDTHALEGIKKELLNLSDKMSAMERKLTKQIKTLTDDLDSERMERMKQQVEIDRLKKQVDLLEP